MHFWIEHTHTHLAWESKHVQARLLKVDSDGYTSRKRARIICHDMHLTAGGRQANGASRGHHHHRSDQGNNSKHLTCNNWPVVIGLLLTLKRNVFEHLFILFFLTCSRGNRKVSDQTPKPPSNNLMNHNEDLLRENWQLKPCTFHRNIYMFEEVMMLEVDMLSGEKARDAYLLYLWFNHTANIMFHSSLGKNQYERENETAYASKE